MLAASKREQTKKKFIFFSCCFIALWLGFTPVLADGIGDILVSIVGKLISVICWLVLGVIETVASAFLTVMAVDINTIETMGFLRGFNEFTEGIRLIAVALASVAVLWQLFNILIGPFIGIKQVQSVGSIITRALIFIPLTYFVQTLALDTLRMFQSVYTEFFKVYKADVNGVFGYDGLSSAINPDTFLADLGIPPSNAIQGPLIDVVSVLISCALMIVISWNLVKLLLEMTQRFVVMLVYVYLSPLAAACGVGANSINISKQSLTLFLSSGTLWILNVWSVGIALSLLGSVIVAMKSGVLGFFLWAVITYGFLKVAQQLDDVFKAVGAANVGFSGSLLDDILSISRFADSAGKAGKALIAGKAGLGRFAENGFFGVKGTSSTNPTKPETTKISSPGEAGNAAATATAAGAKSAVNAVSAPKTPQTRKDGTTAPGLKSTPQGNKPASLGQQVKAFVGGTAIGQIARGIKKTGENIGTRVNNGVATVSVARDNGAMNAVHGALNKATPEARAAAMKNISQNNPEVLNNEAAKEFVGENIGLKDNQSVASLSVDNDGNLSATVATHNSDGSVGLSKVNNINDMSFGSSGEPVSAPTAPKTATYTADQLSATGATTATVGYSSMDGVSHSAEISKGARSTTDGGNMADFSVTPSEGGSPINVKAPANMSAEDVGSVISGTASDATMQKFTAGGGDASAVMSALNVDQNVAGSVSGGSAWENDASTSVHVGGDDGVTLQRTNSSAGGDSWTATNATVGYSGMDGASHSAEIRKGARSTTEGGNMADFSVTPSDGGSSINVKAPANMSAEDVGSVISGTASDATMQKFTAGGGDASAAMSALNVDQSVAGSVSGGSAWQNDPSTSVHIGEDNGVTVQRTNTSAGGDSWTATTAAGESIGSFDVAHGTGAREVASQVMSSAGDSFDAVRSSGGIERGVSDTPVSFTSKGEPSTSVGNDGFRASIESTPNSDTHSSTKFSYQSVDSDGSSYESSGYITPTGNVENGKVEYQYGHEGSVSGTVKVDANVSTEDIAAALANKKGGGIDEIQEVREKLGISADYNDRETKRLKDMLAKAKKAENGTLSSEDAPVGKYL